MERARSLIVFYSRSGTTRALARRLAARLNCDFDEIVETRSRRGVWGYLRSAIEARRRQPSPWIVRTTKDPSDYDLVIIGTPVWGWSVSSPVRAYLTVHRASLPAVAFFCTFGGGGSDTTFTQMRELAGKPPRACLAASMREVALDRVAPRLDAFVKAIEPSTTPAMAT